MTRWRAALSVLTLLAAGGWIFTRWISVPIDELAELIQQGGVRILRDPMRTVSGETRVLVIAFDGVGVNEFARAASQGPNLRGLLGTDRGGGLYDHAYSAPDVLTILPSTTMAVWASIYTGEPPSVTGITGNEWFARESHRFYAPAPVSITDASDTVRNLTDGLLGSLIKTPTIFERIGGRSFVSLAPVYRGADLFSTPKPASVGTVFEKIAKGFDDNAPVSEQVFSTIDEESVNTVLQILQSRGVPQLQVVYFPGVDLYSHSANRPLEDQVAYLSTTLDRQIGRLLDQYRKAGVLDKTYILFIADHGHTPVLNDDLHSLGTAEDDEPTALIEGEGFRLRPFEVGRENDKQDYSAVVAYQGAMAYIYLADRSRCPKVGQDCDWSAPPRFDRDLMPLVRAFDAANRFGRKVPALRGTLDLIFARRSGREPESNPFLVFDRNRLVPIPAYLKQHPRPDLLDLERRMDWLAKGPQGRHAGDILLLAKSGIDRPIEQRFYFSGRYRSWHGSPSRQDSRVPLVLAHTREDPRALRKLVRENNANPPTVLEIRALIERLLAPAR